MRRIAVARTLVVLCMTLAGIVPGVLRAQTPVQADSLIAAIKELYEQGSYLSAEVEARRFLDHPVASDSLKIQAEQYLAYSLVAQAKTAGAIEHLVAILKIDSMFTLDPVLTSPKILSAFAEAQKQYTNWKVANRSALLQAAQQQGTSVSFRTIVFPGWEQIHQGRTAKGYSLIAAGVLSLGSAFYFNQERRLRRDEYLAADTPDLASSRYSRYNSAYKATYYSLAAFVAVYVYSQFDAYFDLPPHLDSPILQPGSNPQLTFHFPL